MVVMVDMHKTLIYKNREGLRIYDIPEDWYVNRIPGISAMLRVKDEEEWIGPCIESILPFFDEIVVALDCSDRTKDILKSFRSSKIKIYDYPYFLGEVNGVSNPDSVHDRAYYSNWALSKTTFTVVAKWDGDMIMLPDMYTNRIQDLAKQKNIVRLCGYNPVALNPFTLSVLKPIDQFEVRFFKVNEHLYFIQNDIEGILENDMRLPLAQFERFTYDLTGLKKVINPYNWVRVPAWYHKYRIKNYILRKDIYVKKPMFIHTKYLKKNLREDRKAIWHQEALKPGEILNIPLPEYVFKKPEDYL